ncbi:MAG: glycosyltransferase [Syntrophobacterales bacterium]
MTIRITHLITDLDIGGAEMMLYKLLSKMDRSRFQNSVVSMVGNGPLARKIKKLGIPVDTLDMTFGVPNPRGLYRLVRLLQKQRPVVLQTWLYHADFLGLLAGKLARLPQIVWNVRCSDMDMQHYSKVSALVIRILAALSSIPEAVVVNSESGCEFHKRLGYRPRSWVLIHNGFDLDRFCPDEAAKVKFRQELGLSKDAILIGLVARFDPMKDHATFLEAAHLLLEKDPRVHFVLVGSKVTWENRELTATINSARYGEHFHLMGERENVPFIMAALDMATSSSYSEGFPNTIGEAMACGVPCVVTDAGDSALLVGDTGMVVPIKNPHALAEGWDQMMKLAGFERSKLGKAARCRIEEQFSLPTSVKCYEELYQRSADYVRIRWVH